MWVRCYKFYSRDLVAPTHIKQNKERAEYNCNYTNTNVRILI